MEANQKMAGLREAGKLEKWETDMDKKQANLQPIGKYLQSEDPLAPDRHVEGTLHQTQHWPTSANTKGAALRAIGDIAALWV